jgi:ATPases with chaperone activity, ATP-binding subunit
MGARPLRRTIQDNIEDKIADFYLEHPSDNSFQASLVDDEITIQAQAQKQEVEKLAETSEVSE